MSARSQTTSPPDEKTKGVDLSVPQIAGGAAASVSASVVASYFGVAGTLIGAAVMSIISTIGAAIYGHSLKKGGEKISTIAPVVRGRRGQTDDDDPPTTLRPALPRVPRPGETAVMPAALDPRRPKHPTRRRWVRIAAYAAGIFVIAMVTITGFELFAQKPVSAVVGPSETSRSTTFGSVTHVGSTTDAPVEEGEGDPAAPTEEPAETTEPETTEDAEPTATSGSEEEGSGADRSTSATPTPTSRPTSTPGAERSRSTEDEGGQTQRSAPQTSQAPQRSSTQQDTTEDDPQGLAEDADEGDTASPTR